VPQVFSSAEKGDILERALQGPKIFALSHNGKISKLLELALCPQAYSFLPNTLIL
jgi:hypothetical protein